MMGCVGVHRKWDLQGNGTRKTDQHHQGPRKGRDFALFGFPFFVILWVTGMHVLFWGGILVA